MLEHRPKQTIPELAVKNAAGERLAMVAAGDTLPTT